MSYKTNDDLPENVKSALPDAALSVWRNAFNSAHEKDPDEEKANKIAWGAVKNAGYEKNESGSWIKKEHSQTHEVDFEVFSTGVHGGDNYTEDDLDDMVRNFAELGDEVKPPLKFGHRNRMHITDGQPALGWGTELKRKGKVLIAKFSHVPDVVYQAIKKKLYSRISSEILWNYKHKDKIYRRVWWAASLLGQDIPVVKDLADLQAFMSQSTPHGGGSFEALKVCEFAYGEDGLTIETHGGERMTDKEKELQAKLDAETEARKKAEAEKKVFAEKLAAAKKETAEKAKTERTLEFKTFCEDMVKAGRMTPAGRDVIVNGLDSGLHVYSEDAGWCLSFEKFKAYAETQGKVLPAGEKAMDEKKTGTEDYATAGQELDAKAKKYSTDHKVSYGDAINAVMDADKDLAERYLDETATATDEE